MNKQITYYQIDFLPGSFMLVIIQKTPDLKNMHENTKNKEISITFEDLYIFGLCRTDCSQT